MSWMDIKLIKKTIENSLYKNFKTTDDLKLNETKPLYSFRLYTKRFDPLKTNSILV